MSEWQRTAAETNSSANEPQNSTPMCSQLMSFILATSLPLPLPPLALTTPTPRRCLPRTYRLTLPPKFVEDELLLLAHSELLLLPYLLDETSPVLSELSALAPTQQQG